MITAEVANYTSHYEIYQTVMTSEVKNNVFDGNQVSTILNRQQTQTQSSDLYILGGKLKIHHNTLGNAHNADGPLVEQYAPNFYHYFPAFYWDAAQASMAQVEYKQPNF